MDSGLALGGGTLQNFGINSNTSANGFIKCLYKKVTPPAPPASQNNASKDKPVENAKLKDMMAGLDEDMDDSDEEADGAKDNPKA